MIRRLTWMAAILFAIAIPWAFAYGPLFPWSALQPGYRTVRFSRADVSVSRSTALDPALAGIDRLIAEAEAFHGMRAPSRLRIVECATWEDFARFCPVVPGRGIGAVTLDIGGVIYLSPRLRERNLDTEEYLRHEITHAIVAENVTLWNLRRMKHHTWLYEGVPVCFARQRSYVTRDVFLERAGQVDLQPVISFDANAPAAAPVEMNWVRLLWNDGQLV